MVEKLQKNYPNAALNLLRTVSASEWHSIPQGKDRLVEIVSLFQKKVPFGTLPWRLEDMGDSAGLMSDELLYLKGRSAFDRRESEKAKSYLDKVSKNSRFYVPARYLLGSLSADKHDYNKASEEFSEVFQPSILDQSSEFWKDVGAQMTSHWGSNFKVLFDTELLTETQKVAELSLLALARVSYASKDYEMALKHYSDIGKESNLYDRAVFEKVWTLWSLNRHGDAQKTAAELATDSKSFYSTEARILRSLILTDANQTEEARRDLQDFQGTYVKSRKDLLRYQDNPSPGLLPAYIQADLESNSQLQILLHHQKELEKEIKALRAEDSAVFSAYKTWAAGLESWENQNQISINKIIMRQVNIRLADLERLLSQSKLIMAETYLNEREELKAKIKTLKVVDENIQASYDVALIDLLTKATHEVEDPSFQLQKTRPRLQFRQAELLWELGTAKLILAQAKGQKEDHEGDKIRRKALDLIEDLASKDLHSPNYDQILFFKGFAEMELGRDAMAIETFRKYVEKFPKHEHVPDAYRILADIKFDENYFEAAEQDYKKVLEFPDSSLVGYALYKLGWCAYNEKLFARALLALEKAYFWTTDSTASAVSGLKKESRKDLISIYAEVGDDHKAETYFKRFTPHGEKDWLSDLTRQYENSGQYEKAQTLYKVLINADPISPKNMEYTAGIIQAASKLQKWDVVLGQMKTLLEKYGPQLSAPKPDGTVEANVEKMLREVSKFHQFEFRQPTEDEIVNRVMLINDTYIKIFGLWTQAEDFLYRDALYLLDKEKLTEAKDAFKQHWVTFETQLKEPLKEEALRNLIHTLGGVDQKNNGSEMISPEARDLLTYALQYRALYPNTKYLRPIMYLYSSTLLKYKKTEEGIAESQKLYDSNPNDEYGVNSLKNLSKAYYDLNDWKRTYGWAKALKSPQGQIIREESIFLWAQNTSDDIESANLFLKIAEDPAMKKISSKSLYNAFVRYNKANKKWEALQAASQLEKISPGDVTLTKMAGIRGALYQEAGDYVRARPLLEDFLKVADQKTQKDIISQAHFNIALIAEAQGLFEKAKIHFTACLSDGAGPHKDEGERELKVVLAKLKPSSGAEFSEWPKIQKEHLAFVKNPLILRKDLVTELKMGAERLEEISKRFIDVSNAPTTPTFYSVETYCLLPSLYMSYSKAVLNIAKKDRDLLGELRKITAPLDQKVKEFAQGCLEGAVKNESGGDVYQEVLKKWGWKKDSALDKQVIHVIQDIEKTWPWLERVDLRAKENEIITSHLRGEVVEQSWLKLARLRLQANKLGLSRLTFIDALSKDPKSFQLANGLAVTEELSGPSDNPSRASIYFQHAGELGSPFAWVNLALTHLKGGRLEKGKEFLKKADLMRAFDWNEKLKTEVKELTGP